MNFIGDSLRATMVACERAFQHAAVATLKPPGHACRDLSKGATEGLPGLARQ
jgi:hypothetical protein